MLAGYSFVDRLRDEHDVALYRARRAEDGLAVLALVARPEHGSRSVDRLHREYALKNDLDPHWAALPLALLHEDGATALVLEDSGETPLDRLLDQRWGIADFLRAAIGITRAIGRMHERELIHKDIKPANILIGGREVSTVHLTGFGIASQQPRERQAPDPPVVIAGTLAYMAPEQTGRMNRSIDSRSDLYSLGVTFYQMLVGTLPFTAEKPADWIHCHVARRPAAPAERRKDVPPPLSAVITKLLAKTAEDRYQTAAGLEVDLGRCLSDWNASGEIRPFVLGEHDVSHRLLIPEKLYGRDQEIRTLLDAFERVVSDGTPELMLVSGYSGIGKSTVVNELHKAIVLPQGIFVSGKFDQYKRDVPYATLAQAFRALVLRVLNAGQEDAARFAAALREALGANGQLVVNLVPELELLIGRQDAVAELPPQEALNRFQTVIRRFIGVFARKEHPLALFLDDLQWLDMASLRLLEDLLTQPDVRYLFLIGAYRDNEVDASHPLMQTLASVRKRGDRVRELTLGPLSTVDTAHIVADAIQCDLARAAPLAEVIQQRAGGNPFFTIHFLSTLVDEQLLIFDARRELWRWDLENIGAKALSDNVVDLMVRRLSRLPERTQLAVQRLACFGHRAELSTLAAAHGSSIAEMHQELREVVRAGLVHQQGDFYEFLHDRVQEAAYAVIPVEQRAELHLAIGRQLISRMSADEVADNVFDVVNQLDSGMSVMVEQSERDGAAELNLAAGRKAKDSAAYASACHYLSQGITLLGPAAFERRHDLAFNLGLDSAECEYLSGHFEKARALIAELIERSRSKADRAAAYSLKVELHVTKSENSQAVDSALECLALFGIEMSPHPTREQVQAECERVWTALGARTIESLTELPLMTDPDMRAAMRLLAVMFTPAFFSDYNLACLQVCQLVNITLRYGTTAASAQGYACFGLFLCPVFGRYADGYRFGDLACKLVERREFHAYKAKTYLPMELISAWTKPLKTAIAFAKAAFLAGIESGDLTISCFARDHLITYLLAQGEHLEEIWQETERGLEFARKARFRDVEALMVSQQRFILNMMGLTSTFSTFTDEQFDEQAFEAQLTADRMSTMVCWYWILKLQARFLSGDYEIALDSAEKAKALTWSSRGHLQLLDYHFYSALTMAATYDGSPPEARAALKERLISHRDQLTDWARKTGSGTFSDKCALVLAEEARIEGRAFDAARLYEDAIRAAQDNGFGQNEAIANELAARFWMRSGFEKVAEPYLRAARSGYLRWGAHGKVRQLDRAHPALERHPAATDMTTVATPLAQLDLAAVLEALQALSSEMVLGTLVQKILTIVIAHAGAQRGLLLLPTSQGFVVEAEAITSREGVDVQLRRTPATPDDLPEGVLRHVTQTREGVIVDDATLDAAFAKDDYVQRKRSRSILCLPVAQRAQLVAVLYLENALTPGAFTPARVAMLNALASQAAISLQNASLFSELAEEKARLRAVIQQVPAGLMIAEAPSGRLIIANDQVEPVLHNRFWPSESIDRYEVYVGFHPDGRRYEPHEWPLARSIREGASVHNEEVQMQRSDGSLGWVSLSSTPVRDGEGRITAGVVILQDIEERKRKERELRRSEARFATAFHNSPAPMAVVRPRDRSFIDANESFLRMLKIDRAQIIGRSAAELGNNYVELVDSLEQRCAADGSITNEDLTMVTSSGEGRTLLVSNATIEIEDEACMLIAFTDLTERKRVEEQLQQSQKLEAIGSLAGGIAHDFNNQLTVINGYSEMALTNLAPSDPNRELIMAVLNAGERAVGLTRKLLAFSRKEVIQPRIWNLNSIVTEMQSMCRRLIEEDVELVMTLSSGADTIKADRGQVEQIIMNLTVNARDAMPEGGRLTLETAVVSLDASSRETVLEPVPGSYVMLSVTDTGIGMTSQVKRQIFEPFFTTKPVGKGTGLGLAVVYGIVKQSGANISVSSEPGGGTTVRIYFPRVDETETQESVRPLSPQRSFGGRETILVVEDEDALREFMARALEAQGYRVLLAPNGREALVLVERFAESINLVVTDIVMPEMGGRDLGAQVRERNRDVPIVYVSGYSKDFGVSESPATAKYFLPKPFGSVDLAKKVRYVLDHPQ